MKKKANIGLRVVGVLVLVVIGIVVLAKPIADKRKEKGIHDLLLDMQEALQNYHVGEEIYPRQMMEGVELVEYLSKQGYLEAIPTNPWTGTPYQSNQPDFLRYRTDPLAETYELIVLDSSSGDEQYRLDSTKNRSLE